MGYLIPQARRETSDRQVRGQADCSVLAYVKSKLKYFSVWFKGASKMPQGFIKGTLRVFEDCFMDLKWWLKFLLWVGASFLHSSWMIKVALRILQECRMHDDWFMAHTLCLTQLHAVCSVQLYNLYGLYLPMTRLKLQTILLCNEANCPINLNPFAFLV